MFDAKASWNGSTADPSCTDCVCCFVPKRTKRRSFRPGGTDHRSKHGVCPGRCAHKFCHGDNWRRFIAQRKGLRRRVLISRLCRRTVSVCRSRIVLVFTHCFHRQFPRGIGAPLYRELKSVQGSILSRNRNSKDSSGSTSCYLRVLLCKISSR